MTHRIKHPLITPARLRKRVIIYMRQSTIGQVHENWGSTSLQRDQTDVALAYGWPRSMIDVIDEDLGRSGASTGHRTGWQEMLRRLPSGTVGAVFTFNVARLSRELRDFEDLRTLAKL
jgi:DNA invertase Pin-like site-specific DNA recombinase